MSAVGISQLLAETFLGGLQGKTVVLPNTAGSIYMGLSTTTPGLNGTNWTEVATGGYARQALTLDTTTFLTPSNRTIVNANPIYFPTATADQLQVNAWGLFSVATGGIPMIYGTLSQPRINKLGNRLYYPAGAFKISMSQLTNRVVKGNTYANAQLNTLRGISPSQLTNLYIALGTQNVSETAGAISIGELTVTGYSRVSVPANEDNFEIVAARTLKNTQEILFVKQNQLPDLISQADSDWPVIKSYAIYDSANSTDPLYAGNLSTDAIIYTKDILVIGINGLTIKE